VFSQHHYPQSALSQEEDPPNVEALMSHINVTKKVGMYAEDVQVARERGFDYVFGETNSGMPHVLSLILPHTFN
jgi:hypothetical protein